MNPSIIPDGLTLFYTLTAPVGSHAAGAVNILCEYHASQHIQRIAVASLPELPEPGSCVLCAEEDAELTTPFGPLEDADDQRAEDERNYCAIVQAGIDRMRR